MAATRRIGVITIVLDESELATIVQASARVSWDTAGLTGTEDRAYAAARDDLSAPGLATLDQFVSDVIAWIDNHEPITP
ncbi:MAG: hypothetical protein AMS20_00060 [Gemmatimonas sp. SG8_28]|nr:MAG: hypothetical protein AMS20_00060 [Gemmatimonas sp. SG8_28]